MAKIPWVRWLVLDLFFELGIGRISGRESPAPSDTHTLSTGVVPSELIDRSWRENPDVANMDDVASMDASDSLDGTTLSMVGDVANMNDFMGD